MMNKIFLAGVLFITACSPESRLNRLLKKNPHLVKTEIIHDTIIVEKVVHDTITKVVFHDTVTVINNERVKLKYFYDTLRETIHHDVECKEVPVVYEKKIVTVEPPPKPFNWWIFFIILVLGLIILKSFLSNKS